MFRKRGIYAGRSLSLKIPKKLHHFINRKYFLSVNWITKKVKSLFQLEGKKNIYQSAIPIMNYVYIRRTILVNQHVI